MPTTHRPAWILSLLAAAVLLVPRAFAGDKERWYLLEMFGGKAGWMSMTETEEGDRIISKTAMQIDLARAGGNVTIASEGEFVETREGKPVSMKRVQKFGETAVVQEYTFTDSEIQVKSTQAGTTSTSTSALPEGTWLTPSAAERYMLQRFKSGAKEITVRTLSPDYGTTPVSTTHKGFEPDTIEAMGRKIEAFRCTVETSIMPEAKSTEWIDAEGELIKGEMKLGDIPILTKRCTKEEALAPGAALRPDAMVGTLIKPDQPIHNPRRAKHAVYLLSVAEGEAPAFPQTGSQNVVAIDKQSVRVTVTTTQFAAAPETDTADAAYTRATPICNTDDAKIKEIAALAVEGADADPMSRAEALRRFVYRFIKDKNLNVGYATASEVAVNRSGDCSEHGVFLTALLRANGYPARVAAGLVYVDEFAGQKGVFGYHMWAQALIEIDGKKRWVDLDGTLPVGMPFDATHIALDTSDLDDSDPTGGLGGVVSAMGRLKIKVESVGPAPKPEKPE
ncbi:hypothetical protein PHYC_02354 [Phycisphaerales bacterium]|nr:hypothetical protein PHYC_02354 [Phycisphaerales bacterium]